MTPLPIPVTPMPSRKFLLRHTLRIELIKLEIEMYRKLQTISEKTLRRYEEILRSDPTSGEALQESEEFLRRR